MSLKSIFISNFISIKPYSAQSGLIAEPRIAGPLTLAISFSLCHGFFPDKTTATSVVPLDKRKPSKYDVLNYRPLSILNAFSKIYEKVIKNQLISYFHNYFSPFISVCRKSYNTQHILIDLLEEWREVRQEFYCECSFHGPI